MLDELNINALYLTLTLVGVLVFSVIAWWCIRTIVHLEKRINYLEDKLSEFNEVDVMVVRKDKGDVTAIRFKNIKFIGNGSDHYFRNRNAAT